MHSSSGKHFVALDHIRAIAAFMVVSWHFSHAKADYAESPALFVLALLDEGHTGVALFMSLSGYLFARLLDGRRLDYGQFLYNRALRLAPLLAVVILIDGCRQLIEHGNLRGYIAKILLGVVAPTLPNGGWSITVEIHFYLLLPLLLRAFAVFKAAPWIILSAALLLRATLYTTHGEVQYLSYWTLVGRIDQFVLGMIAFYQREQLRGRHGVAALTFLFFCIYFSGFEQSGGFYFAYPSPDPIWIIMPLVEGTAYSALIAWYDSSFEPTNHGLSAVVAKIGTYSYSIYLLHFFFAWNVADFVHTKLMNLSTLSVALLWSVPFFLSMALLGHLSFKYVEAPFLRLRRPYSLPSPIDPRTSHIPSAREAVSNGGPRPRRSINGASGQQAAHPPRDRQLDL